MRPQETLNSQHVLEIMQALSVRRLRFGPSVAVIRHWLDGLAAAPDGELPGFDPLDAPALLGYIYILESVGDRMRYRVSGELVNVLFGSNHSGKHLDEVVPRDVYPFIKGFFQDVFDLKACIFKGHITLSNQRLTEFERILLPVRRGGGIQLLGSLALSTSAPLRDDAPVPARADQGFQFTQIDLKTLKISESMVAIDRLPVDTMPFDRHLRKRLENAS